MGYGCAMGRPLLRILSPQQNSYAKGLGVTNVHEMGIMLLPIAFFLIAIFVGSTGAGHLSML